MKEKRYQHERGERQEARILELLKEEPMTGFQLSDALFLSRHQIHVHLRRLMEQPNRRVRIADFQPNPGRSRAIYALGSRPDEKLVTVQKRRIVDALRDLDAPITARELADQVGLEYPNMIRYLRQLRTGKMKRVYIADWTWHHLSATPMFMAGAKDDAKRPREMPHNPMATVRSAASIFAPLGI